MRRIGWKPGYRIIRTIYPPVDLFEDIVRNAPGRVDHGDDSGMSGKPSPPRKYPDQLGASA